MTRTMTYTDTLCIIECCNCSMTMAFSIDFERRRREDHEWWYCPKGHKQHFSSESDTEKARKRVTELERQLASRTEDVRVERDRLATERRRHSATKGELTKTRRRAEKGICLHCHRHFVDVQRHMASQHAELVTS